MDRLLTAASFRLRALLGSENPGDLPLPDFLGIGVPQGASTWLHAVLSRHPEVFLPTGKETEYFTRRYYRSLAWYAAHFAPGEGRIRGEITPGYCAVPRAHIEAIHRLMPDLKLVLVLRNPVDRVWSASRRILGLLGGRPLESIADREFHQVFDRTDVRERTDYVRILENWQAVFSPDQLLVEFYEDVVTDPESLIRRVLEHIGASSDIDPEELGLERRVNRNPSLDLPPRFKEHLRARYRPAMVELRRRYGERVDAWLEGSDREPGQPYFSSSPGGRIATTSERLLS